MPLTTVQNSQLSHNIHSINYFFSLQKNTEYSYLDSYYKE